MRCAGYRKTTTARVGRPTHIASNIIPTKGGRRQSLFHERRRKTAPLTSNNQGVRQRKHQGDVPAASCATTWRQFHQQPPATAGSHERLPAQKAAMPIPLPTMQQDQQVKTQRLRSTTSNQPGDTKPDRGRRQRDSPRIASDHKAPLPSCNACADDQVESADGQVTVTGMKRISKAAQIRQKIANGNSSSNGTNSFFHFMLISYRQNGNIFILVNHG